MTAADLLTPEQVAMLRRLVTDPTLVSDGSLRPTIAALLGWQIDIRYYTDVGQPWALTARGDGYST